ncbi:uncharacterized protein ARMOST_21771 [Armillaria ostoyae]|uniref:Uncharacterized protein n=1 Tax=Armillaria ostoyae TaxID=47428 RepID=A0A284SAZ2_ARMOS|nr:uncharacterized protein ARMOST_21771 [Armillaria ostoyae]
MVGNDANVDMLQLSTRLIGTTEVSNILVKYPEWDRGPCRLRLPALAQNLSPVPLNEDHLTHASLSSDMLENGTYEGSTGDVGNLALTFLILNQLRDADDDEPEPEDDNEAVSGTDSAPIPSILTTPCSQEFEDALAAEAGQSDGDHTD